MPSDLAAQAGRAERTRRLASRATIAATAFLVVGPILLLAGALAIRAFAVDRATLALVGGLLAVILGASLTANAVIWWRVARRLRRDARTAEVPGQGLAARGFNLD